MTPGTYHDTITVRACYDTACNSPLPIAAQTIAVTYTVDATAGPGTPQLVQSTTSLQATAMSSALSPPTPQIINVSVSNSTSLPQFTLQVSQTYNGIFRVSIDVGPNGLGQITVPFQPANELFPAVYTDTLMVKGCYDENCVNVIGGSAQTVTVAGERFVEPLNVELK